MVFILTSDNFECISKWTVSYKWNTCVLEKNDWGLYFAHEKSKTKQKLKTTVIKDQRKAIERPSKLGLLVVQVNSETYFDFAHNKPVNSFLQNNRKINDIMQISYFVPWAVSVSLDPLVSQVFFFLASTLTACLVVKVTDLMNNSNVWRLGNIKQHYRNYQKLPPSYSSKLSFNLLRPWRVKHNIHNKDRIINIPSVFDGGLERGALHPNEGPDNFTDDHTLIQRETTHLWDQLLLLLLLLILIGVKCS